MYTRLLSSVNGVLLLSLLLVSQEAKAQDDGSEPGEWEDLPPVTVEASYPTSDYSYFVVFYNYSGGGDWGWAGSTSGDYWSAAGGSVDISSSAPAASSYSHKLRVECTRADGTAYPEFFLSNDGTCSHVTASFLQSICNNSVWGASTYTRCIDLVKNHGQWVPNQELPD